MLTVIPEVKLCFFPLSRKQSPVYSQLPPPFLRGEWEAVYRLG